MQVRLGDLVEEVVERNPPHGAVVFSVSERLGIVPQSQLFAKKIATDDRSKYRRVQYGDVIYNPYLLWNRAVGVCFDRCGGCVSPAYIVLRPRNSDTERFLHYFFRSDRLATAVDAIATGSVTRRRTALVSDVFDLTFDLPETAQRKAANSVLSSLDNKIELNRRMNEALEAMAQALFKSWFVDAIQNEIPKGWREGKVEELATLSREAINPNEFPDETFDHYSIPAFDEGRLPKTEHGGQIQSNKFIVSLNAVLLSKLNPRIPRVWLPNISNAHRSICSTEFLVATPQSGVSREYLYGLFGSQSFLEVFSTLVTGTSGSHQRVKPEYLLAMDVLSPPKELIARFTETVAPMYQRTVKNIEESRTLSAIRDALLPKLLSGEIRVKDAERFVEAKV